MTVARLWARRNLRVLLLFGISALVVAVADLANAAMSNCPEGSGLDVCVVRLNTPPITTALTAAVALLPILFGLLVGVSALAPEFEEGTSGFAWSVVLSRRRWLVGVMAPGLAATLAVGAACGLVNTVAEMKLNPGHDLVHSFVAYGLWGPILVARAIAAYGIGLLAGLTIRRAVAATALGFVLAAAVVIGALVVGRAFERAHQLQDADGAVIDAMLVQTGAMNAAGQIMSLDDCQGGPINFVDGVPDREVPSCSITQTYLSGSAVPSVELREGLVLVLVGVLCGLGSLVLIDSRKP
jgi:hypothetical protein